MITAIIIAAVSFAASALIALVAIVNTRETIASLRDAVAIQQAESHARYGESLRRRVVVHTRGGHSIDGILAGVYADTVVVSHAHFVRPGDTPVPLEGDQLIPWQTVEWTQEVAADAGAEDA